VRLVGIDAMVAPHPAFRLRGRLKNTPDEESLSGEL
jgi:hypothetical protein